MRTLLPRAAILQLIDSAGYDQTAARFFLFHRGPFASHLTQPPRGDEQKPPPPSEETRTSGGLRAGRRGTESWKNNCVKNARAAICVSAQWSHAAMSLRRGSILVYSEASIVQRREGKQGCATIAKHDPVRTR